MFVCVCIPTHTHTHTHTHTNTHTYIYPELTKLNHELTKRNHAESWADFLLKERESCLLVLKAVTSTPQWIRQPEAACEWVSERVSERVCCLLVLNAVTSTPQWIRQPLSLTEDNNTIYRQRDTYLLSDSKKKNRGGRGVIPASARVTKSTFTAAVCIEHRSL